MAMLGAGGCEYQVCSDMQEDIGGQQAFLGRAVQGLFPAHYYIWMCLQCSVSETLLCLHFRQEEEDGVVHEAREALELQ